MMLFHSVLLLATLLCSLVAGFLFAFAAVVMPGLRNLDDSGFVRAFQVIDGVIQRSQPLFVFVWVGSALFLVAAAAMSIWKLSGLDRLLVIGAALVYVLGVQAPTATINVPLNNQLQRVELASLTGTAQRRVRDDFEPRWNRWNLFRAICASVVSVLLMVLLLRI